MAIHRRDAENAEVAQTVRIHSLRSLCVLCVSAVNSFLRVISCYLKARVSLVNQVTAIVVLFTVLFASPNALAQNNSLVKRLEHAAALISDNRVEEAEQELASVLKVAPNEAVALNLLGAIRAKQRRLNEAELFFSRAVRRDPRLVGA